MNRGSFRAAVSFVDSRSESMNGGKSMNRDFLEMIKTRHSTRSFKPEPIPEDVLDAILEAGTYAPTGNNRQSPVIIAVSDKKYREELSKLNAAVMGVDKDPYYGAPTVVLVLADPSAHTFVEDGSCVLENLMLAAHACDLGSVWVHREREIFDSEEGKKLLREWNLPETLRGVGSIALGYSDGKPAVLHPRKEGYIVKI